MTKQVVVCPKCGSPDVSVDAVARWNIDTQQWELSSTFDRKTCGSCSHENDVFNEVPCDSLTEAQKSYLNGTVVDYTPGG